MLEKYDFILPDMGVKVAFLEMSGPRQRTKAKTRAAGGGVHPQGAVRSDGECPSLSSWFAMEKSSAGP